MPVSDGQSSLSILSTHWPSESEAGKHDYFLVPQGGADFVSALCKSFGILDTPTRMAKPMELEVKLLDYLPIMDDCTTLDPWITLPEDLSAVPEEYGGDLAVKLHVGKPISCHRVYKDGRKVAANVAPQLQWSVSSDLDGTIEEEIREWPTSLSRSGRLSLKISAEDARESIQHTIDIQLRKSLEDPTCIHDYENFCEHYAHFPFYPDPKGRHSEDWKAGRDEFARTSAHVLWKGKENGVSQAESHIDVAVEPAVALCFI